MLLPPFGNECYLAVFALRAVKIVALVFFQTAWCTGSGRGVVVFLGYVFVATVCEGWGSRLAFGRYVTVIWQILQVNTSLISLWI